jgi:nucleoside 2-deoxyribosyltransferase
MRFSFDITKDQKAVLLTLSIVEVLSKAELEYINDRLRNITFLVKTLIPRKKDSLEMPTFFELSDFFDGIPTLPRVIGELRSRALREANFMKYSFDNSWKSLQHHDLADDIAALRLAGLVNVVAIPKVLHAGDPDPEITLTDKGKDVADRILSGRTLAIPERAKLSRRVFVACAFGPEDVAGLCSQVLEPACKSCSSEYVRIDNVEPPTTITEAILESIKGCDAVIADLSYSRPSVYYEVGYAIGMGLPVLLTCRKDHLRGMTDDLRVHFDLEQFKISFWTIKRDGTIEWEKGMHPERRLAALLIRAMRRRWRQERPDKEKYLRDKFNAIWESKDAEDA